MHDRVAGLSLLRPDMGRGIIRLVPKREVLQRAAARRRRILAALAAGASMADVARTLRVSRQWIHNIVKRSKKAADHQARTWPDSCGKEAARATRR